MVVITSFERPESRIKLEQNNVTVILDKKSLGVGTLFVSEKTLSWQREGNEGFSMDYYNVSLHAISKDPNVYDKECIYILTDPHIYMPGDINEQNIECEDSDAESEPNLSELILVPENPSCVQAMYDSIKLCQELNPDPADVEEEDDDNLYADAEEEMYIEPESDVIGDCALENLAQRLQGNSINIHHDTSANDNANDDEEFEDAD